MKKEVQENINNICIEVADEIMKEYYQGKYYEIGRLRNCQAVVLNFCNYYVLKSYNIIVAAVSKSSGNSFDFLRYVYGYTVTSAQHISKFIKDYGRNAVVHHVYR